jgi:hypothetical protein
MPEPKHAQQTVIEVVAKQFSATWQSGEGPPDAYLTVRGRKIALDVATIAAPPGSRQKLTVKARLREDVVAQRVLTDLEAALQAHVPKGKSVILTLGAPIKVPSKLVIALTNLIATYLESGTEEIEEKKAILGNRVRFRVTSPNSRWTAKVIGFVFTGDPTPGALANTMRSLHDEIASKAKGHIPRTFSGPRWLVLCSDNWIADIKTYRRAFSQLSIPHSFNQVLLVFGGRKVETLEEI